MSYDPLDDDALKDIEDADDEEAREIEKRLLAESDNGPQDTDPKEGS